MLQNLNNCLIFYLKYPRYQTYQTVTSMYRIRYKIKVLTHFFHFMTHFKWGLLIFSFIKQIRDPCMLSNIFLEPTNLQLLYYFTLKLFYLHDNLLSVKYCSILFFVDFYMRRCIRFKSIPK